jgi:metallo-beta-lactamase family protein
MQIHFHGATQTVTGSLHQIITADKKSILLDVGMFQGPRELAKKINCCFDFNPKEIHAVILSHGHADHCGNLPNLVKQGYAGPIYCTRATAAITALMLLDSAKIQEENAQYLNQKTVKTWEGEIVPLYTKADAEKTIDLFQPVEYRQPKDLFGDGSITAELRDTGHTLGSASISLTEKSTGKTVVFSGDVGRPNSPIIKDPDPFTRADAFICESTYGGRIHAPISQVPLQLADVVNDTAKQNGILMVPAFALGRTQTMVTLLHQLSDEGKIPKNLPIFVDSPLASRLTDVHRRFENLFDKETREMTDPFDFPNLNYVASPDESRALNKRRGPFIVIASSGMCEAGRILHHLKHHIAYRENTVLLPGYQAQNTLGRRIQNRVDMVPILGDMIPLRCRVEMMDGLSAHADGRELLNYSKSLKNAKTYLVHGEVPQATAHKETLESAGFQSVSIPARGEIVDV